MLAVSVSTVVEDFKTKCGAEENGIVLRMAFLPLVVERATAEKGAALARRAIQSSDFIVYKLLMLDGTPE